MSDDIPRCAKYGGGRCPLEARISALEEQQRKLGAAIAALATEIEVPCFPAPSAEERVEELARRSAGG